MNQNDIFSLIAVKVPFDIVSVPIVYILNHKLLGLPSTENPTSRQALFLIKTLYIFKKKTSLIYNTKPSAWETT